MRLFKFNPITVKRIARFKKIKRGYYSLLFLVAVTIISLFSNYLANSRAIVVCYEGEYYFPTFKFHDMVTFNQEDDWGFDDLEADYRMLQQEFADSPDDGNWLIMPLIPYNPYENDFDYKEPPPNPPDRRHILGTDTQARDVFARLLYGFRISITFSLILVMVSQIIGTIIGSLQGYLGGRFDLTTQRLIETWSALPFLYIVVILATFFIPNFWLLLFIMSLFQWITITYYMRTEMYREKSSEYCLAAQALGASRWRIVFKHLLPNCLTPLVTLTPFAIVAGIFALTALDFLGYGLPAPTPSWGEMIDQAMQSSNRDKLWLSLSPFCAISVTLILVTLIGESVREAFDPKEYGRYQ